MTDRQRTQAKAGNPPHALSSADGGLIPCSGALAPVFGESGAGSNGGSAAEPKERPILFSGPMVRAILEGRKTQTRRVVKFDTRFTPIPQTTWKSVVPHPNGGWVFFDSAPPPADYRHTGDGKPCPFGQPGDRLWVRETWCERVDHNTLQPTGEVFYRATHAGELSLVDGDGFQKFRKDGWAASPWRPSIHMPRWASRLTLEITGVRVERLNDISEADARAEGVMGDECAWSDQAPATVCFEALWDSINGKKHPWTSDPWVWVIEFARVP